MFEIYWLVSPYDRSNRIKPTFCRGIVSKYLVIDITYFVCTIPESLVFFPFGPITTDRALFLYVHCTDNPQASTYVLHNEQIGRKLIVL